MTNGVYLFSKPMLPPKCRNVVTLSYRITDTIKLNSRFHVWIYIQQFSLLRGTTVWYSKIPSYCCYAHGTPTCNMDPSCA